MCFSADASFVASAGLGVGAAFSFRQAKEAALLPLAAIPLFFSVQQFLEAMLWLSQDLTRLQPYQNFITYAYLFMALILWPMWIPFAVYRAESEASRKRWTILLMILGLLFGLYMSYNLLHYSANTIISGQHMFYKLGYSAPLIGFKSILYFIPSVLPLLIASRPRIKYLGFGFLAAYGLSRFLSHEYGLVISLWCFYAALLSLVVLWVLREKQAPANTKLS